MARLRLERPKIGFSNVKKWEVRTRFPEKILKEIREKAKQSYSGNGKISQFADDALRSFLSREQITEISWGDLENDLSYTELLSAISTGTFSGFGDLTASIRFYFKPTTRDSLLEIEKKLKLSDPLLVSVRANIIRQACWRWLHEDIRIARKQHNT